MEKDIKKILENHGWWIDKSTDGWNLSKYSPLGEDFEFYVTDKHILTDIKEFVESYDVDKHAQTVWHFSSGVERPTSISLIVDDARAIGKMLTDLLSALAAKFPELCEPLGSETVRED